MSEYLNKTKIMDILTGLIKTYDKESLDSCDLPTQYALAGARGAIVALMNALSDMETENVAPVVHGKWEYIPYSDIWYGDGEPPEFVCKNCYGRAYNTEDYCPNCGAIMDGI